MLHVEHWDFNRASLIALGHLLTASNTFKDIYSADEIDRPDVVMFTVHLNTLTQERDEAGMG